MVIGFLLLNLLSARFLITLVYGLRCVQIHKRRFAALFETISVAVPVYCNALFTEVIVTRTIKSVVQAKR